MYYIFVENDKINGCGQIKCTNNEVKNIPVTKEIFDDYINEPIKYIFSENEIIENPQYETLKQEQYIKAQIEEIVEKMAIIDTKRIRAICEDDIKDERTGESWLDFYNAQIYDLRIELNSLESQLQ